jgi:hypothetical membrane protein
VQYFIVQVVVAGASTVGYSWSGNTISDLGNTRCARYSGRPVCSPLHLLMNASFVVLGLGMCAGAVLLSRAVVGKTSVARAGFGCLELAGLGTIVVGLFPENTVAGLHLIGAALPFVLGNLGVVLVGAWLPGLGRGLRGFSLLAGCVGLVGLPLFLSHRYLGIGTGGMERLTAYPQDAWLIVIGGCLVARGVARRRAGA